MCSWAFNFLGGLEKEEERGGDVFEEEKPDDETEEKDEVFQKEPRNKPKPPLPLLLSDTPSVEEEGNEAEAEVELEEDISRCRLKRDSLGDTIINPVIQSSAGNIDLSNWILICGIHERIRI